MRLLGAIDGQTDGYPKINYLRKPVKKNSFK